MAPEEYEAALNMELVSVDLQSPEPENPEVKLGLMTLCTGIGPALAALGWGAWLPGWPPVISRYSPPVTVPDEGGAAWDTKCTCIGAWAMEGGGEV